MTLYREMVQDFSQRMEQDLIENNDKGGWEGVAADYILMKIRHKLDELEYQVRNGDSVDVLYGAVKVANYAMILADAYEERGEVF